LWSREGGAREREDEKEENVLVFTMTDFLESRFVLKLPVVFSPSIRGSVNII